MFLLMMLNGRTFLPGDCCDFGLKEVFNRNRVSERAKVFSVYLYAQDLSFRELSWTPLAFGVALGEKPRRKPFDRLLDRSVENLREFPKTQPNRSTLTPGSVFVSMFLCND
ncbi:hypothetical protein AKJ65_07895 [candidate division MSBL1 archaeon SCGC-AAA259E19]|uniref:Uncharacterized protein n=1 Tax=candidate division MSBL1 archaeon SCGC-AAA259E19 TaxID=1698264 RepID=A0A133UDG1_9EURY|nr:hypothetical protein AKJ65_07895 [candidate division MSBL1 archaeon SCGC-AAA259E19]